MIGRFIITCDPEYLDVARDAIEHLLEHPSDPSVMSTMRSGVTGIEVRMLADRLKKSIRVRQVKP